MRSSILLTALLSAASACAQVPPATPNPSQGPPTMAGGTPEARAQARARLIAADTDKDGRWNKVEWVAAGRRAEGFVLLDLDGDGFITQAELEQGRASLRARRTPA